LELCILVLGIMWPDLALTRQFNITKIIWKILLAIIEKKIYPLGYIVYCESSDKLYLNEGNVPYTGEGKDDLDGWRENRS